jgi:hypothetical protein
LALQEQRMSEKTSKEAGRRMVDMGNLIKLKPSDACEGGGLSIEIRAWE